MLELHPSQEKNAAILALSGRFDAYSAPAVEAWLKTVYTSESAYAVVNLSNVHFIDSTGLATLVQGMKRCRQHHKDLVICSIQQPVRIIFELTRFDAVFTLFDTQEEAVSAYVTEKQEAFL